jgi:hypothetical protein
VHLLSLLLAPQDLPSPTSLREKREALGQEISELEVLVERKTLEAGAHKARCVCLFVTKCAYMSHELYVCVGAHARSVHVACRLSIRILRDGL